jgi:hypothetical protein
MERDRRFQGEMSIEPAAVQAFLDLWLRLNPQGCEDLSDFYETKDETKESSVCYNKEGERVVSEF